MEVQGKKVVVWNLDYNFELQQAKQLNFDLFPGCEIKGHNQLGQKNIKDYNVVIFQHFFLDNHPSRTEDLSWADLVFHYTSELIFGPWEEYEKIIKTSVNNSNVFTISSGVHNMPYYPKEIFFPDLQHFFTTTAKKFKKIKINNKIKKEKIFDALLGRSKPHRIFIYEKLSEHQMLHSCFVNITKDSRANYGLSYRSLDLNEYEDNNLIPYLHNDNNYSKDLKNLENGTTISQHIPFKIYENSWYSIVAETNWFLSTFFSEKTAKCILAKRIFVFFGSQGQLALLKKYGYKTFDSIIDETYDDIKDDTERWSRAFDQVLLLSKMDPVLIYKSLKDVLEHNYAVLMNQEYRFDQLKNFLINSIDAMNTKKGDIATAL